MRSERSSMRGERSSMRSERSSMRNERSSMRNERSSMRNERSSMRSERSSMRSDGFSMRSEESSMRSHPSAHINRLNSLQMLNLARDERLTLHHQRPPSLPHPAAHVHLRCRRGGHRATESSKSPRDARDLWTYTIALIRWPKPTQRDVELVHGAA
ncbi:MAG TPA: hypothetical protein VN380_24945 [Thermoanaerobaculia bacterium]|nr:hypothetical protein [Thermoanaerobaculia bacterium]